MEEEVLFKVNGSIRPMNNQSFFFFLFLIFFFVQGTPIHLITPHCNMLVFLYTSAAPLYSILCRQQRETQSLTAL